MFIFLITLLAMLYVSRFQDSSQLHLPSIFCVRHKGNCIVEIFECIPREQAMKCGGYKVVIKSSVYKLGVESTGCGFVVKGSDYELAW
jgi:hypothetical protein